MRFFETSAKDGTNVNEAFHDIAREVVARQFALGGDSIAGVVAAPARGGVGAPKKDADVSHTAKRGGKDCNVQ